MARNQTLLEKRNIKIKKAYIKLRDDKPKWKNSAILEDLSEMFFLSTKTISSIINS